jgi:hypothetical protein
VEREAAGEAARRLREQIARSPLDFRRDLDHGEVEQDLVRTGYLGGSPSSTSSGSLWRRSGAPACS